MMIKFPFPLFVWVLKKYVWVSLAYFAGCAVLLLFLNHFTALFSQAGFSIFIFLLFFIGFAGSIGIFIFVLFTFLKPLALSVQKIEELAKNSSSEESSPLESVNEHENQSPAEFYNLNKNLDLIYKNIQQKTLSLAMEEAELKAITAAVSDAIVAVDLDQKIIFSNPQSQQLFLIPDSLEKTTYISEAVRSHEILSACKKCLKFGASSKIEETLTVGEYQQSRFFSISISPLTYTKDKVDGAVIVFYDQTEIKNTEKSQSDFVSNVSHELKTPLTVIKGFVETMLTDLEEENLAQNSQFFKYCK